MVEVMNYINRAQDEKKMVKMNLLDLSKAFDTVDHDILLNKLSYYGVRGLPLELISSYLTDRKQVVECNGTRSLIKPVTCGVPQGSILGPLLFIVYVNDIFGYMSCNTPQVEMCLYADDTTIMVKGRCESELAVQSERALEKANCWFAANKLKLNKDKTNHIILRTNPEEGKVLKYLGMHVDEGLKWNTHVDQLAKKITSGIYCIKRIGSIATHQAALLTYHSFIHCHLSYGILFWGTSTAAERIFILQKRAIRVLCALKYRESCRGHFKNQKILTLTSLYIYTML